MPPLAWVNQPSKTVAGIGVRGQGDRAAVGAAQRSNRSAAIGVEGDGVDGVLGPVGVEGDVRGDRVGRSGTADLGAAARLGEPAVEDVAGIGVRWQGDRAAGGAAQRSNRSAAIGVEGDGIDGCPLGVEGDAVRGDRVGRAGTADLGAAARLGEPAVEA